MEIKVVNISRMRMVRGWGILFTEAKHDVQQKLRHHDTGCGGAYESSPKMATKLVNCRKASTQWEQGNPKPQAKSSDEGSANPKDGGGRALSQPLSAKMNGTQRRTLISPWRMHCVYYGMPKGTFRAETILSSAKIKLIALVSHCWVTLD